MSADVLQPDEFGSPRLQIKDRPCDPLACRMGRLVDVGDDDIAVLGRRDAFFGDRGAEQRSAVAVYGIAGNAIPHGADLCDRREIVFRRRAAEPVRRSTGTRSVAAIVSSRPWRLATRSISVGVQRTEPLKHQVALVEGDDRRRARQVVRIAAAIRALVAVPDQRDVVAVPELPLDRAHLEVRGLDLLGHVAGRVRRRDVQDLLADQVQDLADERVRRALVTGRDQLHRPHVAVDHGEMVRDVRGGRPAEPDRAEHVQVGHRRHQCAPRQLHLVPVEDVLAPAPASS